MTPEERARQLIDARLAQSGWVVQDLKKVNPMASLGVAVREYPTSTGPVDYAPAFDSNREYKSPKVLGNKGLLETFLFCRMHVTKIIFWYRHKYFSFS